MLFFQVIKYINYFFRARHRKGHGIHSPFVYDLVSRVFRNKTDPAIVNKIESIRKSLLNDHRIIEIHDLGAGSFKMKSNNRLISDIARHSPVPADYGIMLYNLAAEFGKPAVIELGTALGISTMYMASSCSDLKVKTIEGSSHIAEIAKENFSRAGIDNIEVFTGSFEDIMPNLINKDSKAGLVFIDGNHRRDPLLRYFNYLEKVADDNTVIAIDDINYSPEMEDAWNEIRKSARVTVTVDIFRMGLVFFRKGISRSDYMVRY